MNQDTDPNELTPPEPMVFSLPPNASPEVVREHVARIGRIMDKLFREVQQLNRWAHGGDVPCPEPEQKCAALELATLANTGVMEVIAKRKSDGRWLAFAAAALSALATFGAILLGNHNTAQATDAGREAGRESARQEMLRNLKSTEATADQAADRGADRALQKFLERQNPAPIASGPDKLSARGKR